MDSIRGSLYGLALGDALGAPFEFKVSIPNSKYRGIFEYDTIIPSRWQAPRYIKAGQVTDDTEMTLALLSSLSSNGWEYDRNLVILSYEAWANSKPVGMGKNTRELFQGVKTIRGFEKRLEKQSVEGRISQSNGFLMRSSPLALLFDNEAVIEDCKLSNPHSICLDTNLVYVNALRLAHYGNDKHEIWNTISDIPQTEEIRALISSVENREARDLSEKKGWCLHALYASLYSLLNFNNLSDTFVWNIRDNPRCDSDTNAAISGALIGALIGYESLKEEMKDNLSHLLELKTDRPLEYHPSNIDKLLETYKPYW